MRGTCPPAMDLSWVLCLSFPLLMANQWKTPIIFLGPQGLLPSLGTRANTLKHGSICSRPEIRMVEFGSPDLIKLHNFCAGRVPVRLHPLLYRALKLTYPTDVGSFVLDGGMRTELGIGSLGQFVAVLHPTDFRPVYE